MEDYKLLVIFNYANGERVMAEYDKFNDMAKKYDKNIYDLLMDITVSLGANGYKITSSRLLS